MLTIPTIKKTSLNSHLDSYTIARCQNSSLNQISGSQVLRKARLTIMIIKAKHPQRNEKYHKSKSITIFNHVRYCITHQKSLTKWSWSKIQMKIKNVSGREKSFLYLVQWNQALFLLELIVFPQLLSGSYTVVDIVLWDFAPATRQVNQTEIMISNSGRCKMNWTV